MASTVTLTGRIVLPGDAAPDSAQIRLQLTSTDTDQITREALPAGGQIVIDLEDGDIPAGTVIWRNTAGLSGSAYNIYLTYTDADGRGRERILADRRTVGEEVTYDLSDLIDAGVAAAAGTYVRAITVAQYNAAITARDEAQGHAASATTAATSATTAAGTATDAAATATGAAGTATTAATTATTAAATATTAATTATDAATTASTAAGTATTAATTSTTAATTATDAAANAQASALTCATWAALSALTGATAGTGAEVLDSDGGTHTDPVVGGTVANAGRYTWSDSPAGWKWIGPTGLSSKASSAALEAIQQGLTASFDAELVSVGARYGGVYFDIATGSYDWGIGLVGGVDVPAGTVFDAARFALQIAADATQVRYRLWSRPLGAAWMAQGPGYTGDTQHGSTVTVSPSAIGLVAGGARGPATFALSEAVAIESGRLYIHEIEALDAGSAQVKSVIEYKSATGLTTDQYRKWRRASPSPASWSNQVTSTTFVYCYDLLLGGYAIKPTADCVAPSIVSASAVIDGLTVAVSTRCSDAGVISAAAANVTLDAATGGTVTDEALTLTAAGGAAFTYSYLTNRTAHADLRSVVVKDATTLAVLVKGTDYWAIEELGAFSLPSTSGTPRNVLISYVWSKMRYDLIHYTPTTGAIAVTKGTERERDQSEFVPATPVGALPLFTVHVRAGGNIAVPVWDVSEGVRRLRRAEVDNEIARNRRLLRPVMRKLRSGAAVKIVSYGDSNFAQMGGPYNLAAVRSTANTVYHDRTKDTTAGLLQSPAYGADVLATIATYDTGDGAGAVHTRFGLVWELIRALEAGYASTITYRNRSIPGTNSTTSTYHGQDSTRLAAATAEAADIAIIGFGQNELGQTYTRDNVAAICAAFKAAGTIPIVMGCFRPHAADLHTSHTTANWLTTQRLLREAALAADAPHVSMLPLYADGETGPLGLSPYDLCAGTKDVHPGIREHRIIGARIALSLLD